jgi:acetyl esterase/lipase
LDDCLAGLEWLAEHAEEIGIDLAKIIVAGMSGGGGLAAALCLLTRDGQGPQPLGQILMEPMIDDRDTFSSRQMEGIVEWDRVINQMVWGHVLGEKRGTDDVSSYAAPARAEDLSGLPPTYLDVGSAETFRDEVVSYASRIWQAGGAAELHVWPGGFHAFEVSVPGAALSQAARAARLTWLRRLLNT